MLILSPISDAQPTRLTRTESLHRRFTSCVNLNDDFAEQFKARAADCEEKSKHRLRLAEEQRLFSNFSAIKNIDELRAYERKVVENIFQSCIAHKPIFVLGPLDKPNVKKVTKLIPLTEEHHDRFNEITQDDKSTVWQRIYWCLSYPLKTLWCLRFKILY